MTEVRRWDQRGDQEPDHSDLRDHDEIFGVYLYIV